MIESTISEERRAKFRRDGFVVIQGLLSDTTELKKLVNKIYEIVRLRARNIEFRSNMVKSDRLSTDKLLIEMFNQTPKNLSFIYDTLRSTRELAAVLNCDPVIYELQNLFGGPGAQVVSNNLNLRIDMPGEEWIENLPWHQDWPYNNPLYLLGNSIASWIPIFDAPTEVGPMLVKPGSQVVGEVQHLKTPRKGNNERLDQFFYQAPYDLSEDKRFNDIQLTAKAGDLILFDLTLVHKSGINKTDEMVRWSAQGRYHNAANPQFLSKYLLVD